MCNKLPSNNFRQFLQHTNRFYRNFVGNPDNFVHSDNFKNSEYCWIFVGISQQIFKTNASWRGNGLLFPMIFRQLLSKNVIFTTRQFSDNFHTKKPLNLWPPTEFVGNVIIPSVFVGIFRLNSYKITRESRVISESIPTKIQQQIKGVFLGGAGAYSWGEAGTYSEGAGTYSWLEIEIAMRLWGKKCVFDFIILER